MLKEKEAKQKNESEWDKKRIVFVGVLVIFLLIFISFFLNSTLKINSGKIEPRKTVEGISTQVGVRKTVQNQIESIKQEASDLNLVDVATSSPQVQKIINDLKALKDYPNNQLKQACVDICQKL